MALKCTNTSSLPSSGVMKPKPFSELNHFTVPVATTIPPSFRRPGLGAALRAAGVTAGGEGTARSEPRSVPSKQNRTRLQAASAEAGLQLLVAGWASLDVATWRRRSALALGREVLVLAVLAGFAAAVLVAWSVLGDRGPWWIAGASLLAALQLLAAAKVT